MLEDSGRKKALQWCGLAMGPILCGLCLWLLPTHYQSTRATESAESAVESSPPSDGTSAPPGNAEDLNVPFLWEGRATLAVMIWMGVWWLTEAIQISVTALVPMVAFPLLGVATINETCFPYADPLIFLYFGGFVIALSMEHWGLGKRIALVTLTVVGTSAAAMVKGFMLVTAVLSAFVSNTATTAMMLPIAVSVVKLLRQQPDAQNPASAEATARFGTCLMLAIAYSASVGGIMTIIGTPTNAFLVGFLRDGIAAEYRQDLSFAGWLPIGGSLAVLFLPLMYLALTRFVFPIRGIEMHGGAELVAQELRSIGKIRRGEWNTLVVFLLAVSLWLFRPLLTELQCEIGGMTLRPLANLSDTVIAMTAAMLLFLLPTDFRRREFTMEWEIAARMPWGILFLFGGGLSLAAAVKANGVAEFIGSQATSFATLSPFVLVLIVTAGIVFLTELTSNAATTASLVPVLAALAPGLGVHPYLLIFPATIAASCAFMLPVATPPNAIVFGSGLITIPQMVRAGFLLNLMAIALVTAITWLVIKPWLGI